MLSSSVCGIPIRRFLRAIWVLITLFILGSIPWMLIEFKRSSYSIHYQAWLVAGIFVLLAVSVSVYEIAMNLEYFNCPRLQIRVVRILWMVPIYAVNSWLCLRFKDASFYIDPIRECYEAFVIYNFYMYLVTYLEDEVGDPITYFSTKEQVDHLWPANKFLSTWYVLGPQQSCARIRLPKRACSGVGSRFSCACTLVRSLTRRVHEYFWSAGIWASSFSIRHSEVFLHTSSPGPSWQPSLS
jgi:hypothetical protein